MKWYAAAGLLLILALALKLSLLAYAMYGLLGTLYVSRQLAHHWSTQLTAHRTIGDTEVVVGTQVAVAITVRNTGWLPIVWVLLEDVLPREARTFSATRMEVTGRHLDLMMLRGGQQKTLLYQVKCHRRGFYQIGPLIAETGDLFGLHRRFRLLTEPVYLLVEPQAVPMSGYYLESRRPIGEIQMTYRLFEDPSRLAGCRTYQVGDPMKRIHWPATARCGTLQTKIFEPTCVSGGTIVLEFDQRAYDARHEPVRSELAITLAISLAQELIRSGQHVGLVSNGRDAAERIRTEGWKTDARTRHVAQQRAQMLDGQDRLRPVRLPTARSPNQFDDCKKLLARLELNQGLTLSELLHETAHDLPRDATVIAIVPRVMPEDALALGELRRRGYAVTALVNVYDDLEFAECSARLASVGVNARQLRDADHVSTVCQRVSMRWTG